LFRNEADLFDQRTPRLADPKNDVWSLGCLFSELLVWSVLGVNGVRQYQQRRKSATDSMPLLKRTAYSGCFHDGENTSHAVHMMHTEVQNVKSSFDRITSDIIRIVDGMLEADFKTRPTAQIRQSRQKALSRAARDDFDPPSEGQPSLLYGSPSHHGSDSWSSEMVPPQHSTNHIISQPIDASYRNSVSQEMAPYSPISNRQNTKGMAQPEVISHQIHDVPDARKRSFATVTDVRSWITKRKFRMDTPAPVKLEELSALYGRDQVRC
jgi:serine/threonine protein kinase